MLHLKKRKKKRRGRLADAFWHICPALSCVVIRRVMSGTAPAYARYYNSSLVYSNPQASATAGKVTLPSTILTPCAKAASSRQA